MNPSSDRRNRPAKKRPSFKNKNTKHANAEVADPTTEAKESKMQRPNPNNETNAESQRDDVSKFEQDVEATAKAVADAAEETQKMGKTTSVPAEEYEKLKRDLDEAKDRGLRALAELENFRARTNRIAREERKYAALDLARAILPVWDNMGRAIDAAEQNKNPEALVDGVKMMYKEFLDILAKHHIEKIDALHRPFDPNFEESIAVLPSDEFPANVVVAETQAGFKLHDRVVRPAQVVLAAPKPKAPATKKSDANDDSEGRVEKKRDSKKRVE